MRNVDPPPSAPHPPRPTADRPLRVLVTAGPTHEPIDNVRFIGNRSSGAMGVAIAEAAADLGHRCTLLLGPTALTSLHSSVTTKRFRTTADLQALLATEFPHCDVLIMAAAVADYRPKGGTTKGKLPRSAAGLTLRLEATPDLVAGVAKRRGPNQTVVGFALEPRATMAARAVRKLNRKGLDLIVANPLETMESPTINGTVFGIHGPVFSTGRPLSKRAFAKRLVGLVIAHRRATLTR
ncbi:MAG: phosphopantothenoylcysteine decarboxylase [Phycisphaerales bacterium]